MRWQARARTLPAAAATLLLLVAPPLLLSGYSLRVLDLAVIGAIAVVGLVFAFGYAGLVQLGQAAFVGIGAYGCALLTAGAHWPVWLAVPAAMLLALAAALLIGAPLLRLRGHYLALATVGLNETLEVVAKNWASLTGGDDGLGGIPGIPGIATDRAFYWLASAVLLAALLIGVALRHSRFGRAMIAVRDDELASGAAGVAVFRVRMLAFALAALYGALSGALYAQYARFIAPGDFDVVHSITLLVMLIVGGETSLVGAVAGAVIVSFAPEWLRFVGSAYLSVFGVLVLLVLVLMPGGLAGALSRLRRTRHA